MAKQKTAAPFPRLSGRLYIFPALIPMVEILPWLLTAVGAAAGASQAAFWSRHRRKILGFAAVCFLAAGATVVWSHTQKPTEAEGSRLLAAADMSKLEKRADVSPAADKAHEEFAQLWTVKTKNETLASPVIAGNLILLGTFEATLDAHSRADGKLAWSLKKKEPIFTNAAVLKDMAFVGEGLHTAPAASLTALSLPDGKPVWERQFRSHVESQTTLDAGNRRLFTCAGEEGIWALDMKDGAVLWRNRIGHTDATPLLHDGHLYVSAQPDDKKVGAALSSLDPDDGDAEWKIPLPGNTMGSPQMGGEDLILLTTAVGQVGPQKADDKGWSHAVSTTGRLIWSVDLPGMPLPEAAVLAEKGLVIHTLKNGDLIALNVKDGSKVWHVKQGKEFLAPAGFRADSTPPLLAGMTSDGVVSIRNAEDGTEIRRIKKPLGGYAAPVFGGDVLYVTTPHDVTAYGGVHLLTRGDK